MSTTVSDARILTGQVWHERRAPAVHRFSYRMWWADLDVDQIDTIVDDLTLLSTSAHRPLRFRREDYLGDPDQQLGDAVRDTVEGATGHRPGGRIRLLAHLRTFGWCFNPIAIYLCHGADDQLEWMVADVTNTPWKQRHQYVIPAGRRGVSDHLVDKAMHVSPFMPMDQQYRFNLHLDDDRLRLRVDTLADGGEPFSAGVDLTSRPMTGPALLRSLVTHPFLTARVSLGIHSQAARLFAKRVPVHRHPSGIDAHKEVAQP